MPGKAGALHAVVPKQERKGHNEAPLMLGRRRGSQDERDTSRLTGSLERYTNDLMVQFTEDVRRSMHYEQEIMSKAFKVAAINNPGVNFHRPMSP
jgi:hypothetical protein